MKIYNKEKNIVLWDTILDEEFAGYPNEQEWITAIYGDYDYYDGTTIEEYKEKLIEENNYQKVDLSQGYLEEDVIDIFYPEVKYVEGKGHYETIREYPNGGKDVKWVVDVKGVEYQPERHEEEVVLIYYPFTEAQLQKMALEDEYEEKMEYMRETDYVASKLSEAIAEYIANGDSTNVIVLRANYKEVLEKRQQYRNRLDEIKELLAIYEEKGI
jgi:hypothetical protein